MIKGLFKSFNAIGLIQAPGLYKASSQDEMPDYIIDVSRRSCIFNIYIKPIAVKISLRFADIYV